MPAKSPFPGMDPYLEDPDLWSGFHASFIAELQNQLSPRVRPDYFVRIEERVYLTDEDDPGYRRVFPDARVVASRHRDALTAPFSLADSAGMASSGLMIAEPVPVVETQGEEIHEHRLEIRDRADRSVVAVIELLSPSNETAGSAGRASFMQKRREILASPAHWMEIDLLSGGISPANHIPAAGTAYHVYLSRAEEPSRKSFLWPMPLRERLLIVGVPLRGTHADVPLDLQDAFVQVYQRGGYDLDLDYHGDPPQPFSESDQRWIRDQTGQSF